MSDIYNLGAIYENKSLNTGKKLGRYYSPKYIVDYIVSNALLDLCDLALYKYNKSPNKYNYLKNPFLDIKLLDPAMGCGYFLYETAIYITDFIVNKTQLHMGCGGGYESVLKIVVTNCVYGIDIDSSAVDTALTLMSDDFSLDLDESDMLKDHLYAGDTIVELDKILDFWNIESFDAIVGNPPYLTGKLLDKKYSYLGYKYAKKKFDIFWLFYEQAFGRLLKPNGYHVFIIPDGFLVRDLCQPLREEITLKYKIKSITVCDSVFNSANISCVVLSWQKKYSENNIIDVFSLEKTSRLQNITSLKQSDFLENINCRWSISFAKVNLNGMCLTLGDIAKINRGEEIGKSQLSRNSDSRELAICGFDVVPFNNCRPALYISDIKKSRNNYISPKIIICKTGAKLKAALDNLNLVTLQSVYNLHITNPDYTYSFIVALLSSDLLVEYIEDSFTRYKIIFPQINQSTVMNIPIPIVKCSLKRVKHFASLSFIDLSKLADSSDKDLLADLVSALYEKILLDKRQEYINTLNYIVRVLYEK